MIEGNRGLFDGVDAEGTHSTAELAKTLRAPVVLVVDARKATRTLAAPVLGCRSLDPDVEIAGVVLNRVAGGRHESVAREAIENACGVEVLGADPALGRQRAARPAPGPRHAGGARRDRPGEGTGARGRRVHRPGPDCGDRERCVAKLEPCATPGVATPGVATRGVAKLELCATPEPSRLEVAYLRDSAFSFYYPENLEALEAAGASLVPVSSLTAASLPPGIHALYIGGGFPETHAAAHRRQPSRLLDSIRRAADEGLPIYAECGGLMLLARRTVCATANASRWRARCRSTWRCARGRRATAMRGWWWIRPTPSFRSARR